MSYNNHEQLNSFDVEGFILVGGQSRRMGSDKSQLQFAGQTAVDRIASALNVIADRVRLVGSNDSLRVERAETIPDLHEHWGALGGIQAALRACVARWAAIVACDLPLVTPQLFEKLWALAVDPFEAVVPIQPDGRAQPLCAIYKRDISLTQAEALISVGEHMPRTLLRKIQTRWVDFAELAELPYSENFFLNVNTRAEYQKAISILSNRRTR